MVDEPTKIILGDTAIAAIEEPVRRRFFGRRKSQKPPPTHCENCGTQLSGRWCSQCGQLGIDYRRSFGQVFVDSLEAFLSWDSKIFHTIALLITRPWRLTNDFLAGRRARYLHPARLYLIAGFVFFFAVTYWVKSMPVNPFNVPSEQRAQLNEELERENVPPEVRARLEKLLDGGLLFPKRSEKEAELKRDDLPAEERAKIEQTLKKEDLPPEASAQVEEAMKDLSPEIQAKVERALKEASKKEKKPLTLVETDKDTPPNSFENWIETRARQKFGTGTNLQIFLVTLISNLPYMMLACIPLFAFVLKILYLRRRILYIDHLVYALHIHTFAYLAIILIILATMGLNRTMPGALAGWIIALLWATFAVQVFLSIRRVYKQGWFFTIFKFFVGGFAYLIVLLVALAATFFVTVVMPL